ncbi:MAG TPA: type II secretion system F family protein [Limnobacter sp.]|uniref:type II secretion system F family protein n=1 Tax=Limnobacter sp. TaxID=2003368 RepID=UPI002ED9AA81
MTWLNRRVPDTAWIDWMRQWAELCQTGLSALEALELSVELMAQDGKHTPLPRLLRPSLDALQQGMAPEQAFSNRLNTFPEPLQLAIRCAQVQGDWGQALARQSQEWQLAYQFRQGLLQTLSYPALVLASALGLWVLLANTVGFTAAPVQLDLPTALLVAGLLVALLGLGFRQQNQQHATAGFSRHLGRWRIRPALQVQQHFFTMACELEAGIDLLRVLNRPLRVRSAMEKALAEFNHHLLRSLQRGNSLSNALKQAQAPQFLIRQGSIAEHSGNLHQCFGLCARIHQVMAQQRRQRVMAWLSPLALGLAAMIILLAYQTTLAPLYQQLGQMP